MGRQSTFLKVRCQILALSGFLAMAILCAAGSVSAEDPKPEPKAELLRVGTSGSLTSDQSENKDKKEKAALDALQEFIKAETGLGNDILKEKDWQSLAKTMVDGKAQLGVFQGYEYAWVQEKYPTIKPLAIAVNVDRYPTVFVIVKKNNAVKEGDFAGLQGQTLVMPTNAPRFVLLYLNRETQKAGKTPDTFFTKPEKPTQNDPIDAIDDVVDGKAQVTVIDLATINVYRKQKPGRFDMLKKITKSEPMPPVVIAYVDKSLTDATFKRFRDGLINANQKDRGQTMLNTFGLTGFEAIPADFDQILAATRKTYPPEVPGAK